MEILEPSGQVTHGPDVSFLIPAFNQATALERSLPVLLKELQSATFSFEILVSDNASTDETWSICRHWSRSDGSVKAFHQGQNLGFLGNLRFLSGKSTGSYLFFLGCGDLLSISRLNLLVPILKETGPHSLVSGVATHETLEDYLDPPINATLKIVKLSRLSKNVPYQEAFSGNIFRNVNRELDIYLQRTFRSGDVWPHVEIQISAFLEGKTVLRTPENLVSMMQDQISWYNDVGEQRRVFLAHLRVLLPHIMKSTGFLVKVVSLLTLGIWNLAIRRQPSAGA